MSAEKLEAVYLVDRQFFFPPQGNGKQLSV